MLLERKTELHSEVTWKACFKFLHISVVEHQRTVSTMTPELLYRINAEMALT